MQEAEIDRIIDLVKKARKPNQNKPVVFLGAGASLTGGIPLANEISKQILRKYRNLSSIKALPIEKRNYSNLMKCLLPFQRDELLNDYIEKAKINVTHIYLAQLVKLGYIDYVLTTNFDNLMIKALSLFNEFPPIYDMSNFKDKTTKPFKEKSILYLHGQYHGMWLLNTDDEKRKVREIIPKVLNEVSNKRTWIFIGYSGEDPIFEHICNLGSFEHGLFWITHKDHVPNKSVCALLNKKNSNSFIVKGFDSDLFMQKLCVGLNIGQPDIIDKPFTLISTFLENIVDINEDEYKSIRERLEINKKQVKNAIEIYEKGNTDEAGEEKTAVEIDLIKKKLINIIVNDKLEEKELKSIEDNVDIIEKGKLASLLADAYNLLGNKILITAREKKEEAFYIDCFTKYEKATDINSEYDKAYNNWGLAITELAELKNDESLYKESFVKFEKATELNPVFAITYYNWGNAVSNLARLKNEESLYEESFAKYEKAIELDPEFTVAYNNLGNAVSDLAKLKNDESLYKESFVEFEKATELNPEYDGAYNNWGNAISNMARLKNRESLYKESFEKYEKAIKLSPEYGGVYYNWGNAVSDLAKLKNDESLYRESFKKYEKATELNPEYDGAYNNWGNAISNMARLKNKESLYRESFAKYEKATELNPKYGNAYYNWGIAVFDLAKLKNKESLYRESFVKFEKATELNPEDGDLYNNWGNAISNLAKLKNDESLYKESFKKYEKATELNPENDTAFNNWGTAISKLAKLKNDESLYKESLKKYEKATELNPMNGGLYNNCGNALYELAKLKNDESLYKESFAKYKKATELNPEDGDSYNNWGNAISNLAKLKNDESLYKETFVKYEKASKINGKYYNLACGYALLKNKKDALKYLDVALSKNEIMLRWVVEDSDWLGFKCDKEFNELLEKYR